MTPQERQRVIDLFERLTRLESAPREREAEQLIAEGLRQAPHAPYAMIQTILIQEEALERANERIRELEARLSTDEQPQTGGFLDTLRGALAGQPSAPRRTSVPPTRPDGLDRSTPMGVPPGFRPGADARGGDSQIGRGGSFLGQAASIAAGVLVGSLVVDALRGQFGAEAGKSAAQEQGTQQEAQQANYEEDPAPAEDGGGYETADFDGGDFDFG
ncbi:MAG: DUF2076 domain-containing protein [Bradyrhizobiaceae bacterium]|nr:DUF2076 domain-containing protein [Bradyrhizobiaceae bacterium]